MDGFTDTLLPTDRWPWSDVTGMNPQPLHSFQLPSRSWEWEGDWYVDQSCGGEPSQTGVRKVSTLTFLVLAFGIVLLLSDEMKPRFLLRAGNMQLTSRPTSPQTRSGTPVYGAGVGSATGDTSHKAPGQRLSHSLTTVYY